MDDGCSEAPPHTHFVFSSFLFTLLNIYRLQTFSSAFVLLLRVIPASFCHHSANDSVTSGSSLLCIDAKAAGMRKRTGSRTKCHALIASPPASLHSLLNCKCYCTFSFLPTFRAAQCKHTTSVRKFPNQRRVPEVPPETEWLDEVG